MQNFCFICIGLMSFFWSSVTTKIYNFFVVRYLRLPRFIFKPFFVNYAFKSTCVIFIYFRICSILAWRSFSQIAKSIICLVTIDVVNILKGPFLGNIKPSKSMRLISNSINSNANIFVTFPSSKFSCSPFLSGYFPCEFSSFFIIMKKGSESFMRDVFHNESLQQLTI